MAKIKKIWLNTTSDGERERHEIRVDWDNDRHQAMYLRSLAAEDVAVALKDLGALVNAERVNGEI